MVYLGGTNSSSSADYLIQSGLAKQIRFHGKRFAWFVSDVTRKDWDWLLNTMVYGDLFKGASEVERESLRRMGRRWKVKYSSLSPTHTPHDRTFLFSNTNERGSGFTSNTPSGVQGTRSGILSQKPLICSCICHVPTWCSSKAT